MLLRAAGLFLRRFIQEVNAFFVAQRLKGLGGKSNNINERMGFLVAINKEMRKNGKRDAAKFKHNYGKI